VTVGRVATAAIVIIACLWAPVISSFSGVFNYIQEIWGFISPGIVACFIVGLLVPRAPALAGRMALLLGPVLYAICRVPKWIIGANYTTEDGTGDVLNTAGEPVGGLVQLMYSFGSWAFLHHMGLIFLVLAGVMLVITAARPRSEPVVYPTSDLDTTVHPRSYIYGSVIIAMTVALYIIFW